MDTVQGAIAPNTFTASNVSVIRYDWNNPVTNLTELVSRQCFHLLHDLGFDPQRVIQRINASEQRITRDITNTPEQEYYGTYVIQHLPKTCGRANFLGCFSIRLDDQEITINPPPNAFLDNFLLARWIIEDDAALQQLLPIALDQLHSHCLSWALNMREERRLSCYISSLRQSIDLSFRMFGFTPKGGQVITRSYGLTKRWEASYRSQD